MFLDPIQWAEKYFYFDSSSMYQGRWRLDRTLWLADPMLPFGNSTAFGGLLAEIYSKHFCISASYASHQNPTYHFVIDFTEVGG